MPAEKNKSNIFILLKKYDVPGPRYTSYPTVPAWSDDVTEPNYLAALGRVKPEEALSLYFHIPFCEKLCHFCGCFKTITKDHSRSAPYVETLLKEIQLVTQAMSSKKNPVTQIHFGGGTPNFLEPAELSKIMQAIRNYFTIMPEAEIAIEMHPRTTTQSFCEQLQREGFNRISLGVQDFDDHVQTLINRHQTFAMTKKMMDDLRALGFSSFNFDLIYGLPGQSLATFQETLKKTIELSPNRLAVYSYAHVPWKSPVQRSFKDSDLPSPELKLKLLELAIHELTQHGYQQVGMDHFAKKDDELFTAVKNGDIHRNFMGYSTHADAHQIGFGVSSISYTAGDYFQNSKNIEEYTAKINNKRLTTIRGYCLDNDDKIRRDVITDIMCRFKIIFSDFERRYDIKFEEYFERELVLLNPFREDGLLTKNSFGIEVTDLGKLVLRNIAMVFDVYLEGIQEGSKNPVFSRTV